MKSNTKLWRQGLILGLFVIFSVGIAGASDSPELIKAAKKQDWETVQGLLKRNLDVNFAGADGTTALAWAVYWDNIAASKLLIKANAEVNVANDIGVSPLMLAVMNRSPEMIELLLEAGASPETATWSGETPLMTAARTGLTEAVSLLLDQGADINYQEPRRGQNALMWAISYMHPETARVLIDRGANVSARTIRLKEPDQYTPMLLEGYGANVTSIPQGGYTALMFAARVGDIDTARLLIDRGANLNDISVEDGHALVIAASWGHETLALLLLNRGADPNIPDANGMTTLHYAMRDGLKLLHGYEIVSADRVCGFASDSRCKPLESITDEEKEMLKDPLHGLYIVEGLVNSNDYDGVQREILPNDNMLELAEALLAKGADVNAAMKYPPPRLRLDSLPWLNLAGATPFFLATAALDNSAMEMLLEHGASPLIKTDINNNIFEKQTRVYADDNQILGNGTALMVAVGMGKKNDFTQEEELRALTAAKRLIELGADVNDATATGWTALHAAAFIGADTLINFLVEKGANVNAINGCGRTPLSLAEGDSVIGLLDRTIPRPSTVQLLLKLGAGKNDVAGPVGECVLGRGGLEADIEFNKEIQSVREQQRLEQLQNQQ